MDRTEQDVCRRALADVVTAVAHEVNARIAAIVVYGSVARGEATKHSDADVLIVGRHMDRYKNRISAIRCDVDLASGTLT